MANKTRFILSTEIEGRDWAPLFVILYKAFKDAPGIRVMYPGGLDAAYRDEYANRFKNGSRSGETKDKFLVKMTDQESGEIVSFVSGVVYRGSLGLLDGSDGKAPPPIKLSMVQDPKERELWEWYWTTRRTALRTEVKKMWVPNVYVQSLCTDPAWQHHGAATKLMDWVVKFTYAQKIDCCSLTASPSVLDSGFYHKLGFRVVYQKEIKDKDRFPEMDEAPLVVMIKELK